MKRPWNEKQLFSSTEKNSEKWETPDSLFTHLYQEFGFDLDAAAEEHNAKLPSYISPQQDSLSQDWFTLGTTVWLNPPYGRQIKHWIRKAYEESLKGICVVVLTFARTDTDWWHTYARRAAEIRMIKGRVKFVREDGHAGPATAPSALLIFDEKRREPIVRHVEVPRE
jgi:site-specific DNA-methyltransferase (adenine-specific)